MSFFDWLNSIPWGRTDTEIKRDNYDRLHGYLNKEISTHDKKISEIQSMVDSYKSKMPYLSQTDIPSDVFEPKRKELTDKLNKYMEEEDRKRRTLTLARDKAYQRYQYYKSKAISENGKG